MNPQPTYEEVKECVLKQLRTNLDFCINLINGCIDEDLIFQYPEWDKEYGEKHKLIIERKISFVEKDLCKKAIYNRYRSDITDSNLIINVDNTIYVEVDYHDLFRKYDYPKDKLFSLEETLQYISKYKSEITVYDYTYNMLREFWIKHPDGMICFM